VEPRGGDPGQGRPRLRGADGRPDPASIAKAIDGAILPLASNASR